MAFVNIQAHKTIVSDEAQQAAGKAPKKRFWKVYFWFSLVSFLIFSLVLLIGLQIRVVKLSIFDWSLYISAAISIIGLYSFVFKKQVFSSKFWLFSFLYLLITWILITLFEFLPDKQLINFLSQFSKFFIQANQHPILWEEIFRFLLQGPTFYAIYKLSRSKF